MTRVRRLFCLLLLGGLAACRAGASPTTTDPAAVLNAHADQLTAGPATVRLHEAATLHLKPGYLFAPPAVVDKMMADLPAPPSRSGVLGLIVAANTSSGQATIDWRAAAIQWLGTGHIKDSPASFDAPALLARLRQGVAGQPQAAILGWHSEPAYDRARHQLTWAITMRDDHNPPMAYVVNRNVKLVRDGIFAFSITAPLADAAAGQSMARDILDSITPADRHRHDAFSPSIDRPSPLTLAALIAGGEPPTTTSAAHPALAPVLVGLLALLAGVAFFLWKRRQNM